MIFELATPATDLALVAVSKDPRARLEVTDGGAGRVVKL
jgi:hypothetical protein